MGSVAVVGQSACLDRTNPKPDNPDWSEIFFGFCYGVDFESGLANWMLLIGVR